MPSTRRDICLLSNSGHGAFNQVSLHLPHDGLSMFHEMEKQDNLCFQAGSTPFASLLYGPHFPREPDSVHIILILHILAFTGKRRRGARNHHHQHHHNRHRHHHHHHHHRQSQVLATVCPMGSNSSESHSKNFSGHLVSHSLRHTIFSLEIFDFFT